MISELIKLGECSTVDFESGTITVTFPDRAGVVSRSLPLVIPAGSGSWNGVPRPKDTVLCVMLGNGLSNGFCAGRVPDAWLGSPGQEGLFFEDGSQVFYDLKTGAYHIKAKNVIVEAETVSIKATTVNVDGNLAVTGTVTAANIGG
ncbi:hypothetical protein ACIOBL_12980 [Paenibacillus taichungensis]|uniref:hypothetical protein n=1 Tax=Paenibacillus taichungensis TaxID=484184 RepID=UPI00382682BB